MDSSRHAGKVVIVTGAASGIGQGTVLRLAGEGAGSLAATSPSPPWPRPGHPGAGGLTAELVSADVTKQQDVERVVAAAGARIDILADVAGIMDHYLPVGDLDDQTWERVLAVNVTGGMRLSRAVLPLMLDAGAAAIVTVASKASLGAGASGVAYTTSKHAVLGLVKHIACSYGPRGIRSNAVLPGRW